jgi:hypothetical protein
MRWSSFAGGSVAYLTVVALGCGDAGNGSGIGTRGYGYTPADTTNSSINAPPGSWNEPVGSFNEGVGCGTEEIVYWSDLVNELFLPVCSFVDQCFPSSSEPSEPEPGGVQPANGEIHTLGGSLFPSLGMSPYCDELVMSRVDADPNGSSSDCGVYAALAWVLKTYPSCDGAIPMPRGVCMSTARQCASDIERAGCAALAADQVPVSCAAFEDSSDSGGQTQTPAQPD